MLHMPSPMLMAGGRGYDEWLAQVQSRGIYLEDVSTGNLQTSRGYPDAGGPYLFLVQMSGEGSRLLGSSWGSQFARSAFSNWGRAILHGLPDADTYSALTLASQKVLVQLTLVSARSSASVTRNGFTSESTSSAIYRMTELSWWDTTLDAPLTSNAYAQSAPAPYPW